MLQDFSQEPAIPSRRLSSLQEGLAELCIALVFLVMGIAALLDYAINKQH